MQNKLKMKHKETIFYYGFFISLFILQTLSTNSITYHKLGLGSIDLTVNFPETDPETINKRVSEVYSNDILNKWIPNIPVFHRYDPEPNENFIYAEKFTKQNIDYTINLQFGIQETPLLRMHYYAFPEAPVEITDPLLTNYVCSFLKKNKEAYYEISGSENVPVHLHSSEDGTIASPNESQIFISNPTQTTLIFTKCTNSQTVISMHVLLGTNIENLNLPTTQPNRTQIQKFISEQFTVEQSTIEYFFNNSEENPEHHFN
jgi:hypothetical protein